MYLQMIATFAVADEFVSERDKFPGFSLILADQPPDSFETPQALIGLSLLPGYGRAQILVEELIRCEILHRDEMPGHQFAHLDLVAGGLSRPKFGLHGLLKLLQVRRAFSQLIEMLARLFGPGRIAVEREVLFPIALRLKEEVHSLVAERAVEPGLGKPGISLNSLRRLLYRLFQQIAAFAPFLKAALVVERAEIGQ